MTNYGNTKRYVSKQKYEHRNSEEKGTVGKTEVLYYK